MNDGTVAEIELSYVFDKMNEYACQLTEFGLRSSYVLVADKRGKPPKDLVYRDAAAFDVPYGVKYVAVVRFDKSVRTCVLCGVWEQSDVDVVCSQTTDAPWPLPQDILTVISQGE